VADTQGTPTTAITGLAGAVGLAITPDGSSLYAALCDSRQVIEVDTASLTITRQFDLSAYPCPTHPWLAGSQLWVGYGDRGQDDGGILNLNLAAPEPTPVPVQSPSPSTVRRLSWPLARCSPPGRLASIPRRFGVYDVTGSTATLRDTIDGAFQGDIGGLNDMAITADGSTLFEVCDAPQAVTAWDTTSLTELGTYASGGDLALALALSPDGGHLAVATDLIAGTARAAVRTYDAATGAALNTATRNGELVPEALAFSSVDVFSVLQYPSGFGPFYLYRMKGATLPGSSVTLTPPPAATAREPLTISGRLTLSDGTAPGAQQVTITRELPDGTTSALQTVTTAPDGTFTITDTPPVASVPPATLTYNAQWDGTDAYRWSTGSVNVAVAPYVSTMTLSGPSTGSVREPLQFTGTLDAGGGGAPPGASLNVLRTVTNRKGTATTWLPTVPVATDGTFAFSDTPTTRGQYSYQVIWRADEASTEVDTTQDVTVGH
jgi:hypothetical protein